MKDTIYSTKNLSTFIQTFKEGLLTEGSEDIKFIVLQNEIIFWDRRATGYFSHEDGLLAYKEINCFGGGFIRIVKKNKVTEIIFEGESGKYGYPKGEFFIELFEKFRDFCSQQAINLSIKYEEKYNRIWQEKIKEEILRKKKIIKKRIILIIKILMAVLFITSVIFMILNFDEIASFFGSIF